LPFCQDSLFFVICSQYNEAEGEEGADSDDGRSKSAKPGKAKNKGKKKEDTEEHDDESKILKGLFGKGVHSALKHDIIVEASNPEQMIIYKEADEVAKKAAAALRASRELRRETEFDVPTWTGRSGEEKHHTQIQTKLLKSCGNRNCWGSAGQEIRHQAQPSIEQPVSDP